MNDRSERSAPHLVGDLVTQVTGLFRKELQLFRAELNEKMMKAAAAVGMIVAAVVLALTALNVLAAALVVAIQNLGVPAGWAAVIVGLIFAVIALILASMGMKNLKASSLAPDRTVRAAGRDADMVKEKM